MMNWIQEPWVQATGWALLHSLWQIALAGLLWLIIRTALRKASPNLRYMSAVSIVFSLPVWFALTWWTCYQPEPAGSPVATLDLAVGEAEVLSMRDVQIQPITEADWETYLTPALPWLTSLWLGGMLLMSARFALGWRTIRKLRRRGRSPLPDRLIREAQRLSKQLGIARKVSFSISEYVQEPITLGYLKPLVLIPAGMISGLPPEQLEAILLHELAHVKRADFFLNLIQSWIEVLFFFHPVVWWISHDIRKEREMCCDDLAVKACKDPLLYAEALTRLQLLFKSSQPSLSMNASGKSGQFTARIHRLFQAKPHQRFSVRFISSALVILLMGMVIWIPAFSAQEEEPPSTVLQQLAQGNGLEWEITPNTSLEELQSGIHAMARKGAAIRLISHQYELNKLTEAVFLLGSANLGFQRAAFRGIQRLNLSWDQATKVPTFASFVADQGSIKPVAAREFLFTQNMSQEEFQAQIGRAKATGYQLDFSNSKFNAAGQLQSLYVISPEFVSVHWDNFEEDQGSLLTLFGHQEQLLGLNLESAKVTLNAANNIAEAVIKEDPVEEIVEEENFVLEVRTNFKMTDPNSDFSASGGGLRYIMRDPDLTQEELPVPPPIVEEIHEEPIRIELDIKEHEVGGSKAKPLAFLSPNKGKKVPLIVINGKPYPNREKGLKALQALDPTKIKYVQVWKKGQKAHLYGDYPHGVVEIIMKGYMPEVKVGEKPVVKPIEKEIASPFKSGLKPGLVFVMIDGKPFEYREGKPFSVAFKVIKEKGWKEIGAIVIREPGSKAGSPLATDVPVVHLLTPEYEELYFAREKANDQTRIRLRNGKPGEPLYVIDGIPMKAEGLKQVEPNEIEMVSVLKNQAATAIYGSSGENGVVIISTKNNTEKGHEWEPNLEEGEIMFIVDGKEHKAHSFAELQISMEDIAYIQPLKLEDIAYIQPLKKEIARERYGLEQAVAITTLSSMGLPHHKDDPKKPSVGATPFLERVELKVYPNRVQDKAQIEFSLPESAPLGLRILDMQGKTVDILAEEKAEAGPKRYTWSTQGKADGTYLVQLRIGNEVTAKRIVVKK